jgi:hypothetical protein
VHHRALDIDNSGAIDFSEFVAMYLDIKKGHTCTVAGATAILSKRCSTVLMKWLVPGV